MDVYGVWVGGMGGWVVDVCWYVRVEGVLELVGAKGK